MRNKFDEQLHQLNDELLNMGSMVEQAIEQATEAMLTQDKKTAKEIMNGDDIINQQQKKIENICFQLLIQQQPVARDLRVITAAMKMVTDMERIGDQAADISELTLEMADKPYQLNVDNIKKMTSECLIMLINAINAYVEKDIKKAEEVIMHDMVVDELFLKVKAQLVDVMRLYPEYEENAADLLMVNKYLERVGDHASNIAEWVIFALDNHQPMVD